MVRILSRTVGLVRDKLCGIGLQMQLNPVHTSIEGTSNRCEVVLISRSANADLEADCIIASKRDGLNA